MESIFDSITVPGAGYGASVTRAGAAGGQPMGRTGLIASVESAEFERLVKDTIEPVVLWMNVQSPPIANGRPVPKRTGRRYAMACSGIVFVSQSVRPLQFAPDVRSVECQAIVYENKPLGQSDV
jgi:hypothetical protein